jgi:hypothetical protein
MQQKVESFRIDAEDSESINQDTWEIQPSRLELQPKNRALVQTYIL